MEYISKKTLYLFAISIIVIVTAGFVFNGIIKQRQHYEIIKKEDVAVLSIATAYAKDTIEHWMGHVPALANDPDVIRFFDTLASGREVDPSTKAKVEQAFLATSNRHHETAYVRFIDIKGKDLLLVQDHQLLNYAYNHEDDNYFSDVVKANKNLIFFSNEIKNNLIIISNPIHFKGKHLGVLVIAYKFDAINNLFKQLVMPGVIDNIFITDNNNRIIYSTNLYALKKVVAKGESKLFYNHIKEVGSIDVFEFNGSIFSIDGLPIINSKLGVVTYAETIDKVVNESLYPSLIIYLMVIVIIIILSLYIFKRVINSLENNYQAVVNSTEYVEEIFTLMKNMLFVVDGVTLKIKKINQAVFSNLGFSDKDLINESMEDILYLDDSKTAKTLSCLLKNKSITNSEVILLNKSKEKIPVIFSSAIIKNSLENAHELICVAQDVTQLKIIENKLDYLAKHDELTRLSNRLSFDQVLKKKISECKSTNKVLTLMYLDLDKFKRINDDYGHAFGDLYLVNFAERLCATLRPSDETFRLGGDEFAVISTETHDVKSIEGIAERVLKELIKETKIAGVTVTPSVSIGVARYPMDGADADSLIKAADTAMYKAKSSGGNQYKIL